MRSNDEALAGRMSRILRRHAVARRPKLVFESQGPRHVACNMALVLGGFEKDVTLASTQALNLAWLRVSSCSRAPVQRSPLPLSHAPALSISTEL